MNADVMIRTQAEVNLVLDKGYCCIGSTGTCVYNKHRTGKNADKDTLKLKRTILYVFALANFQQTEEGEVSDENVLTETERDYIMDAIIHDCGCVNFETDTTTVDEDNYWIDGYTDTDTGENSYNG